MLNNKLFRKKFQKYLAVLSVESRTQRAYFINLAAKGFTVGMRLWVIASLYKASVKHGLMGSVEGLSVNEIIWMVALVQAVGMVTGPEVARLVSEDVRRGDIVYSLLRPYSYIMAQFAGFWGRSIPTLISGVSFSALITWLLVGGISISLPGFLAGTVLFIIGSSLHCLISLSMGIAAFWLEDIAALRWIYQKLYIALGGMIMPLAIFPEWARTLAEILPFSQLFYAGAEVMIKWDVERFMHHLGLQLFWIVFFLGLTTMLFSRGVRNVVTNGG